MSFKIRYFISVLFLVMCMQANAMSANDNTSDQTSDTNAPGWINGEPDMYPNFKYLSATGSASDAEQAKARALSNLAKIFEVQIREVSTTSQDTQTSLSMGVETVQKQQRISSAVNLKTDKMVQGARIAEQWRNSADLSYYALAVLDREQGGNNIRSEMNRLDEETQYALDQQKLRENVLLQIADLYKANSLQQDRMRLQKTLKIIDIKGKGLPALWSLAELDEKLQQTLRSMPLSMTVKTDDIGGLLNVLQGAVSDAGFNATVTKQQDSYQLAASLEAQQPVKQQGWHWLRATLKIELISNDGVTVIGYQSWPLKVSAGNPSQLESRMLEAVDKKLKEKLLTSILEFTS